MKQLLILLLSATTLIGCQNDLDQKIFKCEDGNYYKLEWRIGGLYAPEKIDTNQWKVIRRVK